MEWEHDLPMKCAVCGDTEADLEVTIGRTVAHPTRSGATVDVDVEKDVPMCVECYNSRLTVAASSEPTDAPALSVSNGGEPTAKEDKC